LFGKWSGAGSSSGTKATAPGARGVRLPVNRAFERELAYLESFSDNVPDVVGIERLRKALDSHNNYLVAKAAKIAEEHKLTALYAEVRAAYERFFVDPTTADPQCWAKNALVKTLVKLGCRETQVYLRGLRHHQNEPVWGGHADTAGELRGNCVQALLTCQELSSAELLSILLEPLVDEDKSVRMEAARAIGQVGGITAALMLKLRILIRKEDPEILGACFSALLGMGHTDRLGSIALVAEFLHDGEDAAAEAAFSLAETHEPAALSALIERRKLGADAWFESVLDHAIVLTRLQAGMDFLLNLIEDDGRNAGSAIEAISRLQNSPKVRARVANAVAKSKNERVQLAFRKFFPEFDLDPRRYYGP
jgi:HEAT repeat protein